MKNTGMARRVDRLGRIVIPIEVRRCLEWNEDALIQIFQFGHYILLRSQKDNNTVSFSANKRNPILSELCSSLDQLTDEDLLLLLEVANRLVK